ncbi:MAG: hypothetical protein A4S09_04510 [Proteobacteria bacterium SG_bin7]|nr:MAG: hypothetical protein A4S09_04510 [Proteobacteria bacterium SG_bin7]
MKLKVRSRKILKDLFREYTHDDYEFDRGDVYVTLKPKQASFPLSIQALTGGLEKYKIVTLDFRHVKEVGRAAITRYGLEKVSGTLRWGE